MASSARQVRARLEADETAPPPALPDEIVTEILVRVASHDDLARASAACVTFCRIISDPSFLRRHSSLHPPLLLGFVDGEFLPAEAPHPSAPAARAFARAADFDFMGYLPHEGPYPRGWGTSDVRDGRVLLKSGPLLKKDGSIPVYPDLAICDPLYRGYRLLPPIPGDLLLASIQVDERNIKFFDACIVPSGDGEQDTTFRVMGMIQCPEKFAVFIFSSGTGNWSIAASTTWEALGLTVPQDGRVLDYRHNSFAYGCFYRKVSEKNKLLKFNISTPEFSTVDLPPGHEKLEIFIVEAGKGMLGIFSKINAQKIRYSILQNGGQESMEWKMVNINNPFPSGFFCFIVGALGGYIFLLGQSRTNPIQAVSLSVEVETLKFKIVGRMMGLLYYIFPYFGYPPSMSPRRI